jgi:phage baseplate assembly protein gpV
MMRCGCCWKRSLLAALLCAAGTAWSATAPTAAITASSTTGAAPLPVAFDASASSADATTFYWEFGDGGASNAVKVTHIYNVAGTYTVTLTVTNDAALSNSSTITITVTGSGEGPVSSDVNFRWAVTSAKFTVKHNAANTDALTVNAVLNTVDLPGTIRGLAASFTVNDSFTIQGILAGDGSLQNPEHLKKPTFYLQVNVPQQRFSVSISKANLAAALAISGAGDITTGAAGVDVPVKLSLTLGAQTYDELVLFHYVSTAGGVGTGRCDLPQRGGAEGFFLISQATAVETVTADSHFFQFVGYLALPNGKALALPPTGGTWTFTLNEARQIVLPFDRFRLRNNKVSYSMKDRTPGGLYQLVIDLKSKQFTLRTWDVLANASKGGTGLPLKGHPFNAYNFTVRVDLDQPGGTVFQAVTATRLTRKSQNDAVWQTGRH